MRLGSESTDFVIKKVNVHKIVKEIVHKYARMFIQKKIKLDFQEFDICVVSDEKWLGFVIGQILSNAIKYTHKGSVLVYVQYRTYTGNGIGQIQKPVLVIEDTGIGINSSDLPRICERDIQVIMDMMTSFQQGLACICAIRFLTSCHTVWRLNQKKEKVQR